MKRTETWSVYWTRNRVSPLLAVDESQPLPNEIVGEALTRYITQQRAADWIENASMTLRQRGH